MSALKNNLNQMINHYTRVVQPVRDHFENVNIGYPCVIKARRINEMNIRTWKALEGNFVNRYFAREGL